MPLSIGDKLGPYEILAPIGAGGMGEVKARDTRLDRIVAIETSSEKFSERFEREARAIAALNHPNIGRQMADLEHRRRVRRNLRPEHDQSTQKTPQSLTILLNWMK
jgi:serine/threonine protein kinase